MADLILANITEGAASVASSLIRPAKKIATLKVCFLEDNARSLNGRLYPKSTVDRILASALLKLANPDSLPVTCFISHETANSNANTDLVGRVTKVWREGNKIYAYIDLADTRVARDMLALAEGGYMRSESMRVLGVELKQENGYDLPLVVPQEGVEPELLGIDLTTRPGLMDTARIQSVLYESAQALPYTESFSLETDHLSIQSKEPSMKDIPLYLQILTESAPAITEAGMNASESKQAHMRIHDHLAGVLDDTVKAVHGNESAAFIAGAQLSEQGRAIALKHATRLAAAHDESAKQCGMSCEGAYNEAIGIPLDTDQDTGDGPNNQDKEDDGESANKGATPMTEAEAMALLAAKGYSVAAPKSEIQVMKEQIEEQNRQIAALLENRNTPPQRQTQAIVNEDFGSLTPESLYAEGDYMAGELKSSNWRALSNRRVPWPKDIDPSVALHELAPFMAHRLLSMEAEMRGRDISSVVGMDEQV